MAAGRLGLMFHLYFGAFDLVMYLGGAYTAIVLANAICDRMDAAEATQVAAQDTTPELAPMQPIDPSLTAPVAKSQDTSVQVSVR
jgi:hypothetical protein